MARDCLLGLDIGTQGAKALVCGLDGRVLADAYREHSSLSPQPGWAEHDAEQTWWAGCVDLMRQALARAEVRATRIAGIGICSFVPSLLPVDEAGRPLRPGILYTDRRAQEEVAEVRGRLGAAGISEAEVGPLSMASPVAQWLWVRRHEPEVFARTAYIMQAVPFIVFRLTGQHIIDHGMKRSYAPLYDAAREGWSPERARLLGLETRVLPGRIAWATERAGRVTAAAAAATGLAEDTPVAVGTADAFAELVGTGVVAEGTGAVLYGTFMAVLLGHDHPVSVWHGFHCLPGLYFSGAAVPTGAALTRWFRDTLARDERTLAEAAGENAYARLEREAAAAPPGCDGLVAVPDFSGEPSTELPGIGRGALVGLQLSHTRGHLYRALLEGVAYELRRQLEGVSALPPRLSAGGGGSRNALWTQIVSDVLDVPQDVLAVPHSAAYGAAYLGGLAAGVVEGLEPLRTRWLRIGRRVEPQAANQPAYERGFAVYCAVRERLG